ncbi:uncharacterized protein DUF4199 [Ancylomarina subtilis]|uniref:Uncharacterized protein DUF4199 n=1 Tax=Ancylomarina subtilis TaxID=1639035 RepID=A0A4Q7VBU9_9BACT|nr:DUF4199 domain-containing protein [Ancylomarina subtilis]RZT93307.1 uncharacterized protein DUF4199 [Ancylomarina subtilis]
MQSHSNPLLRHSFLFGSLVGGILILTSLMFYFRGVPISINPQITSINYFLIMTGIYFGLRIYRNDVLNGVISYGRALGAGVLIIGIAGAFYAIYIYILIKYFDASILQEFIDLMEKSFVEAKYNEKDIELLMSFYEKITPGVFAFAQWFSKLGAGFFFSLILAFFFSRNYGTLRNKINDKKEN